MMKSSVLRVQSTATRMDKFTRQMLEQGGLLGMVGKAERGPTAIAAIRDNKAVYLMAVGGAAYSCLQGDQNEPDTGL